MLIEDSITKLKGVGTKRAQLFAKLEIQTLGDVLKFYPRQGAYVFLEQLRKINTLKMNEKNICVLQIMGIKNRQSRRGLKYATLIVKDETGYAEVLLFATQIYRARQLKPGDNVLIIATATEKHGKILLTDAQLKQSVDVDSQLGIIPTYKLIQGLSQNLMQQTIKMVLCDLVPRLRESLPAELLEKFKLIGIREALNNIHFPQNNQLLSQAVTRLVFEELFHVRFALHIQQLQQLNGKAVALHEYKWAEQIVAQLPFELTADQRAVWQEIRHDLSSGRVMQRLLQGDVGSGKTIIAALTMLSAVQAGKQAAILVPTEVLARQHFTYLRELLAPFGVKVGLLIGNMGIRAGREIRESVAAGRIDILVGTHAILRPEVRFADLRMLVIDEQHRFGVEQRQILLDKAGGAAHLLVMSATPIPRTLALAMYGNLDISVIETMPANRKRIQTLIYDEQMRDKVYQGAQRQVGQGRQVYVVCPLIEEDENGNFERADVHTIYAELSQRYFATEDCGLLHGRMSGKQKEQVMQDFVEGRIKVLVSTTVIEVGVNVPNASLMIVEGAELFGLAQLHQLRGRVGRGEFQSYCALLTGTDNFDSRQRLELMVQYSDGFVLAEQDLKIRGAGEMLGTQQHGLTDLHLADIVRDSKLILEINDYVKSLTETSPLYVELLETQKNSIMVERFLSSLN